VTSFTQGIDITMEVLKMWRRLDWQKAIDAGMFDLET
jgi:hypothetical protein